MKIWVVVKIDHYGGDMLECWCTFNNFESLEVFTDKAAAEKYADEHEKSTYAGSAEVIEKEIKV